MPLPGKEAVVTLCHPSNEKWKSDDRAWAYPVAKGELTKIFDKNGFFDKQSIINRDMVDDMYRILHLGVYETPELPRWHKGRVCVIGDGAHAISPFLGQGANQAIQDGYLLSHLLMKNNSYYRGFNYEKAFRKFYAERQPTVNSLVMVSKGMELVRMRESYLSNISRKVMRVGVNAPDCITRYLMLKTFAPRFIK